MEATKHQKPIKMGTRCVWSWIDSYQWLIECYTANGWENGGEWYFITLKSGHQIYGFDEQDNGSFCMDHDGFVSYDGWDITDAIPALIGTYLIEV
jgi:hypothetical protein